MKKWILLLLLCADVAAFSQSVGTHKVKITVLRKGTGTPLAKVEARSGEQRWYTSPAGVLELDLALDTPSSGELVLSRKGFLEERLRTADLLSQDQIDIYLFPAVSDDELVVIKGERKLAVSKKTISAEESKSIAPRGDPAQIVKLLPGVQSQAFGADVVIRGSGPNDSKYYIDDIEVPFLYHGVGQISVLPPSLIENVDFESGGFDVSDGDATGGVIRLLTKSSVPERPKTEFVVNIPFFASIYHERPLSEDSMMAVGVRQSYVDVFVKAVLDSQKTKGTARITLVPKFADATGYYLKKNDQGHLKASLIAAEDSVSAVFPADFSSNESGTATIGFSTRFANIGVEKMTRLSDGWSYKSTPQLYFVETKFTILDNTVDVDVMKIRIPTELTKRLSPKEDFYFGFDPVLTQSKTDVYAIIPQFDDPTFDPEDAPRYRDKRVDSSLSLSTWVGRDFIFNENLRVVPGLRGFYNDPTQKTIVDPRLRVNYKINDQHSVKSALGQYAKAPEIEETSKDSGNPNLAFEKSLHAVFGIETKWNETWTSEVQVFAKTTEDLVVYDPITRYSNDGSMRSSGLEVFLRRAQSSRLFGWLSYTYSKTEERDSPSEAFRTSQYDQTHVINLAGGYKLTGTLSLAGRYNHHTGDPYTSIKKAVYNSSLDKYQPRTEDEDLNASRLPAYDALTLYLNMDFLFDTWKMAGKLGVESFWTKKQVLGVQSNYDYSKEEYQEGLGAIPFLEVSGEF